MVFVYGDFIRSFMAKKCLLESDIYNSIIKLTALTVYRKHNKLYKSRYIFEKEQKKY